MMIVFVVMITFWKLSSENLTTAETMMLSLFDTSATPPRHFGSKSVQFDKCDTDDGVGKGDNLYDWAGSDGGGECSNVGGETFLAIIVVIVMPRVHFCDYWCHPDSDGVGGGEGCYFVSKPTSSTFVEMRRSSGPTKPCWRNNQKQEAQRRQHCNGDDRL